MRKLLLLLAVVAVCTASQAQILVNGGFDAGDTSGWTVIDNGGTVAASTDYIQAGSHSLIVDSNGAGAWSSPQVLQTFAASEGQTWGMSGYYLHPDTDPITDGSFGLFKIVFRDSGGVDLTPTVFTAGQINTAFPGIESLPFVNSSSATDSWIFAEAEGVAPAGTAEVLLLALNVNQGVSPSPVYFDSITAVPEPSTFALLGGLAALGVVMYRRRRK